MFYSNDCKLNFMADELYIGLIPRNLKIFNFKPNLSFLSENYKNDN